MSPLFKLTEKDKKWLSTSECDRAFLQLKQQLTSAPILTLPHFEKPFILDVDASGEGLGAVLSQRTTNGYEYVIAYASRVLTKSERKYSATRREMLALIWGIKYFRPYLYGQRFEARTDHNSLKWLHSFREPEGQVARWLEVLSEYDFTIVHRPGAKHSNADALSRSNCSQQDTQDVPINQPIAALVTSLASDNWLGAKSADEIQAAQRADPNLLAVATWLEKGTIPSQFPKNCNQQLQALWNQRHHLLLRDGIVYRQWKDVPGNGENQKLQLVCKL